MGLSAKIAWSEGLKEKKKIRLLEAALLQSRQPEPVHMQQMQQALARPSAPTTAAPFKQTFQVNAVL